MEANLPDVSPFDFEIDTTPALKVVEPIELMEKEIIGAQPLYATPRNHSRKTKGGQVAITAEALGMPLMPWQRYVVDVALEINPKTDNYFYDTVVVTVPRQSGKSALVGAIATHRGLTKESARIWYTAQTGKDASTWMRDEHHAQLTRAKTFKDQYRLRRAAGSESVDWPRTGSRFRVFPPMRDAMHGRQSDCTFLDEVWAHDKEKGQMLKQAIRPTMATRIGSQLWILSTMGDDNSQFLEEYVEIGRAAALGGSSSICYFEWAIGENDDPEDMDVIVNAHPAIGYTITREALEHARVDFGTDVSGWARAYGNKATHSRTAAFPPEVWEKCGAPKPELPTRFGIGIDVRPDGSRASVVAGWIDAGGNKWVEVLRDEIFSDWVAQYVVDLAAKYKVPIGYDTAGTNTLAVADDIEKIKKRGVVTRGLTTREFAVSCSNFASYVMNGNLRHSRQPALNKAVQVASRRPILDAGWAWGRKQSSGYIAPLVAATVALKIFEDMPAPRTVKVMYAKP